MTTKQGTIYVADDGAEFTSKTECVIHEVKQLLYPHDAYIATALIRGNGSRLDEIVAKLQAYIKK